LIAKHGREDFAAVWLRHKDLDWAADLFAPEPTDSPNIVTLEFKQ
jgi:hypothetical protein